MRQSSGPDIAPRTGAHRVGHLAARLEAAREDERRLVGRALHDDLGQLLTGVRLELAAVVARFRAAPSADCGAIVDRLQAAVGLVELSARAVRELANALRPAMLDQAGLLAAAEWEASVFQDRTGIRCHVRAGPFSASAAQSTALFRILLEALTNVARHSNAGAVSIRFRQTSKRLIMQVRDNGRGIAHHTTPVADTMGLIGMRERARAVEGDVRVTRLRSGGTRLVATLPRAPVAGDIRQAHA